MGRNRGIPSAAPLEREIRQHMQTDDTARLLRSQYTRGIVLGIGVIILSVVLFCGAMFLITSNPNLMNFIMVGIAIILMVACIIVVPIRLRRLQSGWFGAVSDSAEAVVSEMVKKIQDDQKSKPGE